MAMVEDLRKEDPEKVGPYHLFARLGSGSFGIVYAARQRKPPEELAAVKVARPEFTDIADFQARFRDEVAAIERVKSPFIPKFIDYGTDNHRVWMATELIPGPSLHRLITWSGPLPEEAVWHLGAGIARALAAIHACGIVHRDLRPKNVLLVPDGPRVIDFSLAYLVDIAHRGSSLTPRADWGCMSPEEAQGGLQAAQEPADVLALCGTLVYAATAHPLWEATSSQDVKKAVPNLDRLPAGLRDLVKRCVRKSPDARPKLAEVQAEFDSRIGGAGHEGFAASLQLDIVGRLERYRDDVAGAIGGHGSSRPVRGGPRPDVRDTQVVSQSPAAAAPAISVRWTSRLGSWVAGPIALHGSSLVVTCLDGTVTVLRTADGKVPAPWREPVDVRAPVRAGALLDPDDRRVAYIGAADGRVHAIDLVSRLDHVVVEAAAGIEGTPVKKDGQVYALSADGCVHAVDPRTGARKVLYRMGAEATGALSAASGSIFAADTKGRVHAIGATDGQPRWLLPTDGLVLSAPLVAESRLYIGGTDGALREIPITNVDGRRADNVGAPVHVAPALDGNWLYVGSSDGVLHAYDIGPRGPQRLKPDWKLDMGAEIAGLAVSSGRIYVAAGYQLMEVDAATRRGRELLRMDCLIGAPPVITERDCYVVGLGGVVTCLALR
jgi:outer membrane protein assembly factor BamB